MIGLLINLLVLVIILAVVFTIAKMILAALGYPQFTNIILAIVLLIGLIWFLGVLGMVPGGGPIVRYPG